MTRPIKPARMYSDDELAACPRERWEWSMWVDFVESAETLAIRSARLSEAPLCWQASIAVRVGKRAARAAREGRPG